MRCRRERIELVCLLAILALLGVPKKRASDRQVLAQTLVSQAQDRQAELPKVAIELVSCAAEGCLYRAEVFGSPDDRVKKNFVGLAKARRD